jgi:Ohr subfamily peroxiredoxin
MATNLSRRIYTAEATIQGGRLGHGWTSDRGLDVDLRLPVPLGGKGGGANPEQLFALGYGACFQSAVAEAGRRLGIDASQSKITSRVTFGLINPATYSLAVELEVAIPGLNHKTAERVVQAAHKICPYSNATRDNIEVSLVVANTSVAPVGEEATGNRGLDIGPALRKRDRADDNGAERGNADGSTNGDSKRAA